MTLCGSSRVVPIRKTAPPREMVYQTKRWPRPGHIAGDVARRRRLFIFRHYPLLSARFFDDNRCCSSRSNALAVDWHGHAGTGHQAALVFFSCGASSIVLIACIARYPRVGCIDQTRRTGISLALPKRPRVSRAFSTTSSARKNSK
jgi:hypothetical protein